MTEPRHRDRILGSLLGLAVGDCLGSPLDGLHASTIRDRHGIVSAYLDEPPIWSRVTQEALVLVEATVRLGSPDPSWIERRSAELSSALEGLPAGARREASAVAMSSAAPEPNDVRRACGHAGCANLARVVPIATALAHEPDDATAALLIEVSVATHRELRGICAALAAGWAAKQLRREPGYPLPAARGRELLEELAAWLRKQEARVFAEVERVRVDSPSQVHDLSILLGGLARRFDEGFVVGRAWLERYASARLGRPVQATEACSLCVVPLAIALVFGSERRFEETLTRAVNLGHGASARGALVGGLAGAAAGASAIVPQWRRIEAWDSLVAWGDALARATLLDAAARGEAVREDLPDLLELERRLTRLAVREPIARA